MANKITVKQYQNYRNKSFDVRVFDKDDKFKVIEYSYKPLGLIDAHEYAEKFILEGHHVLIMDSYEYRHAYITDGTIRQCYDQLRMLIQLVKNRIEKGVIYPLSERQKLEYLHSKGYVFMDAYRLGAPHKINDELESETVSNV